MQWPVRAGNSGECSVIDRITESIVEDAALTWFEELGYAIAPGPRTAPGEMFAERASFGEVVLDGRLRETRQFDLRWGGTYEQEENHSRRSLQKEH